MKQNMNKTMKILLLTTEDWTEIDNAVAEAEKVLGVEVDTKKIDFDVTNESFYNTKKVLSWGTFKEYSSLKPEVILALGYANGGTEYDTYGIVVDKHKAIESDNLWGMHTLVQGKSVLEVYAKPTERKHWGYPYTTYTLIHEIIHAMDRQQRGINGKQFHKYLETNDTLDAYITDLKTPIVTKPTIPMTQKHLQHYWEGNDPKSIILHTTLGDSFAGAYETLKARSLSYNYVIDENGARYEIVPWNKSAWHSGVKSNPNKRAQEFYGDTNPNKQSVGIAFVRNGQDLNEWQVNSCVELIKWIGSQTKEVYTEDNIFAHQEITDYKPKEVLQYRMEVIEALFGEKEPVEEKIEEIKEAHKEPEVQQHWLIRLWTTLLKIWK